MLLSEVVVALLSEVGVVLLSEVGDARSMMSACERTICVGVDGDAISEAESPLVNIGGECFGSSAI